MAADPPSGVFPHAKPEERYQNLASKASSEEGKQESGPPAQQPEPPPAEPSTPPLSDQTKAELAAGKKAVEATEAAQKKQDAVVAATEKKAE